MATTTGERWLSPRERTADALVHAAGLAAAIVSAAVLIAWVAAARGPGPTAAAAVYAFGMIAMFGCSAVYNLGAGNTALWRRLDHAAIFVMIAGTYTPFTTGVLHGAWAIGFTTAVWAVAAAGVLLKLTRPLAASQALSGAFYVAFGWIGVIVAAPFRAALAPHVLALLVAGGILYTLGTVFFALKRIPYQRAIWHGFVLAGAAVHFVAVAITLAPEA